MKRGGGKITASSLPPALPGKEKEREEEYDEEVLTLFLLLNLRDFK